MVETKHFRLHAKQRSELEIASPNGPGETPQAEKTCRIAIVHDWLPVYGGAERVLEQILRVFPGAELYSTIDLIPKERRDFLLQKTVSTSFLQKNAWVRTHYRLFLALMPLAIEQFDLSRYDLIISSSYAVAKGVITGPGQLHICYCHSPMRYAWDLQHQYLAEARLTRGPASWVARALLHFLRMWDAQTHQRVDHFLTNSAFVRGRIRKFYGRESLVVYPPLDIERFVLWTSKEDYYVTASRLVPYKMIGLIVDAFAKMPNRELRVIGEGPEYDNICRRKPPNVKMLGFQPSHELTKQLQRAKAFIFAAEEDFGIAPLEAQACGTPVIAFGRGGALETVIPGRTGLFFLEQSVESLCGAIVAFEKRAEPFDSAAIREHAEQFSAMRFRRSFYESVVNHWWATGRDPKSVESAASFDLGASEPPMEPEEEPLKVPARGSSKRRYGSSLAKMMAAVRAALF